MNTRQLRTSLLATVAGIALGSIFATGTAHAQFDPTPPPDCFTEALELDPNIYLEGHGCSTGCTVLPGCCQYKTFRDINDVLRTWRKCYINFQCANPNGIPNGYSCTALQPPIDPEN